MCVYFHVLGQDIPAYGCMIALGLLVANLAAVAIMARKGQDLLNFVVFEAYLLLGGFIGSKALFLIINAGKIDWSRFFEPEYFNMLMESGYVFYGGLLAGLFCVFLCGKLHKIDVYSYMREFIWLVPLVHGFGRIGCFLAGCCYGIPYNGPFAVVFPENSYGLSGIPLFPVQLLEAVLCFATAIIIFALYSTGRLEHTVVAYLACYAVMRFALEYLRYDSERGSLLCFSTSQWISLGILAALLVWVVGRQMGDRLRNHKLFLKNS